MRSFILIAILSAILANAQNNVDRSYTSFSDSIRPFQLKLLYHTGTNLEQHLVIAPFSVWALMSVLSEGAAGETNKELRRFIGKINNRDYSHEGFANVTKFFQQTSSVTIERTSSLFHELSIPIKPGYARDMRTHYSTIVQGLDVSQPQVAAAQVNEYFKKATHGRIGQIVTPQDMKEIRIILTETLYFKGNWMKQFNASETKVEKFFNNAGQVIGEVNLMYQRTPLGFSDLPNINGHVIELPYGERDQFAMLVMLPYHGVSIVDMYLSLANVPFRDIFQQLAEDKVKYETDDVDVWLPRFKISTDVSLVLPLTNIGIQKIFSKDADFSRMTDDPVYVTNVIHKAEIEVTEEGTVASAASVIPLSERITVPKFRADRPFLFIILEKASETILFSGIYSRPSLF